jgi:hypothetical protein
MTYKRRNFHLHRADLHVAAQDEHAIAEVLTTDVFTTLSHDIYNDPRYKIKKDNLFENRVRIARVGVES